MTGEQRKQLTEKYLGWAETWATSLAFAVTQSVEKSERIVADSIVAMIATEAERKKTETGAASGESAVRFAESVWALANASAFRGFGADAFFRMPALAR